MCRIVFVWTKSKCTQLACGHKMFAHGGGVRAEVCGQRCAGGVSAGGDVGGVDVGEEVVCHEVKYDKPTKLYIHTD